MLREALQRGPDAIVEDRRAFRAKDVTPKAKVDEIAAAKELIRTRD
jgi:hypothetical protein